MASNSPTEVNIDSDTALSSTQMLDFDDDALRAIAEVYMIDGNKEYREKQFNNAIHFYTEGLKVDCKDEELNAKLYSNRATAYFSVGNYTDTLSDVKATVKLRPTFIKAIVKGASACMELNLFDEALVWCVRGLDINENNEKLLELKSRLLDRKYSGEQSQIKREATAYRDLGFMYDVEGQYFKAIKSFEKSLEIHQAIGNREEQGRSCNYLGAMYGKIQELDVSIEWFEKELSICEQTGDTDRECTCYMNLSGTYFYKGQIENAIKFVEKALEISKETGNIKRQKDCYSNMSGIFINVHQYEKGIECSKKALQIMKKTGDKKGEGRMYNHLGEAFHALGLHEKSIKILEKALEINSTVGSKEQEGNSCRVLGRVYRATGKLKNSAAYFEKAACARKENSQSKQEGWCYIDLGGVLEDMGQYEKSIEYYEKALLIAKERGYTDNIATCYNNLGSVYGSLDQHEKSIEYYKKAFQLHVVAEDREGQTVCLINLGAAYIGLKKYEESIPFLKKSLEISKAIGNKTREVTSCINLGHVYTRIGQYEKSAEFLNKALESANTDGELAFIYANLGTAAHSQCKYDEAIKYLEKALKIMKKLELRDARFVTLLAQLGISYTLAAGDKADVNFEKARYYLLESIESHEQIRGDLKDEYKISVDDGNVGQYEHLSWMLSLLREVNAALCVAERGRARALEDLMSKKYAIRKLNDSHELRLDELSCLFIKEGCNFLFLVILIRKLFWFVTKSASITLRPDILKEWKSIRDIDQDLLQDLLSKVFKSSRFRQPGDCEDRSLSILYDAESPALEEQAEGTQEQLRGENEEGQDDSDLEANLCLLYNMIFAPVADLLEGPEIVICPEGHMLRIPFAALKDANGKYLAEKFRLRMIPSLTTLKLIYDSPANYHAQTGALVVGDPKVGRVEFNGKIGELPPIPNARSEVKMVARLLGVSPLLGEQATKQEVLMRIQDVSLVHIAAHSDSERGEIAFATNCSCDRIPKKEDFVLTMEDIAKVGIRAKLVVLSCCHSGSGKILKSEGVVGIARAFLGSGARSVLVSLWAINDAATKAFMNMFYKFLLLEKLSASEALHLSMKKMRESPLYNDIIYWAPFVLIGDDVTIDL